MTVLELAIEIQKMNNWNGSIGIGVQEWAKNLTRKLLKKYRLCRKPKSGHRVLKFKNPQPISEKAKRAQLSDKTILHWDSMEDLSVSPAWRAMEYGARTLKKKQ